MTYLGDVPQGQTKTVELILTNGGSPVEPEAASLVFKDNTGAAQYTVLLASFRRPQGSTAQNDPGHFFADWPVPANQPIGPGYVAYITWNPTGVQPVTEIVSGSAFSVVAAGLEASAFNGEVYGNRRTMRKKLGLLVEEVLTGYAGTTPPPGKAGGLMGKFAQVDSVTKNGTLLQAPADYTFTRPSQLTYAAPLLTSDVVVAVMVRGDADADLDECMYQAHSVVMNALKRCALNPSPQEVIEIGRFETDIACAIWREDQQERNGKDTTQMLDQIGTPGAKPLVVPGRHRARAIKALEDFLQDRYPESYIAPGNQGRKASMGLMVPTLDANAAPYSYWHGTGGE